MNKHQIVILRNAEVVENMMSKISSPSELRARLAKRFKGPRRIYFRINKEMGDCGAFFVDGVEYTWCIDYTDIKKDPKLKPIKGCCRNPGMYSMKEGDIISFPKMEDAVIVSQQVRRDSETCRYLIQCTINGRVNWCNISDMRIASKQDTSYDSIIFFEDKRIRVDKVELPDLYPHPIKFGLLTGKPIKWIYRPITPVQKCIEYTEL